jgi:hypothetical protein
METEVAGQSFFACRGFAGEFKAFTALVVDLLDRWPYLIKVFTDAGEAESYSPGYSNRCSFADSTPSHVIYLCVVGFIL